jgi:signal transduction histidine kinase
MSSSNLTLTSVTPSDADGGNAPTIQERRHFIGFSVVIFSVTFALALLTANECVSVFHLPSVLYGVVLWCWWGVIASSIWTLGRRSASLLRFSPQVLGLHLLTGSALAAIHLLLLGSLHFNSAQKWHSLNSAFTLSFERLTVNRFGFDLIIYGFIVGAIAVVRLQLLAQRAAIRSLELERQLSASQLRALQSQLEPHFLFNTLNAITSLVGLGRREQAMQTLGHLNDILHTTLRRSAPEKVPLSQELEIINHYLAIEKVRFSDRLHVFNSVDPEALDGLVPCFLLQPLVENAIRHGIANCEDCGIIKTSAVRDGAKLIIQVSDNGPGINGSPQPGHGIGLRNTSARLSHFYAERSSFCIDSPPSGGFIVSMTIPYEKAPQ